MIHAASDHCVLESAAFVRKHFPQMADTALVLGSGLNFFAETLDNPVSINYADIPHFPHSTAPGHHGRLVLGETGGNRLLVLQGRFHLYEGYEPQTIAFVVRVLHKLGITRLILTNSSGGINESFQPGDLMLLTDHINLTGRNPLVGANDEAIGPRFPDMSRAYAPELRAIIRQAAVNVGIGLREGVYAGLTGPSFETPAEIRMLRILGADAVGMSTVMEAIAAAHCGMQTAGLSCISNLAAGILDQPITVEEVMETGERVKGGFAALLRETVRLLP